MLKSTSCILESALSNQSHNGCSQSFCLRSQVRASTARQQSQAMVPRQRACLARELRPKSPVVVDPPHGILVEGEERVRRLDAA